MGPNFQGQRADTFAVPASQSTALQIISGPGVFYGVSNPSVTSGGMANSMTLYDSATTTVTGQVPIATYKLAQYAAPSLLSAGNLLGIQFKFGLVAAFAGAQNSDLGPTILATQGTN